MKFKECVDCPFGLACMFHYVRFGYCAFSRCLYLTCGVRPATLPKGCPETVSGVQCSGMGSQCRSCSLTAVIAAKRVVEAEDEIQRVHRVYAQPSLRHQRR